MMAALSFGSLMSSRTDSVTTAWKLCGSIRSSVDAADLHPGQAHVRADAKSIDVLEPGEQRDSPTAALRPEFATA